MATEQDKLPEEEVIAQISYASESMLISRASH